MVYGIIIQTMAICPSCQAIVRDNAKFCTACGVPFPAERPSQPPPAPKPEWRFLELTDVVSSFTTEEAPPPPMLGAADVTIADNGLVVAPPPATRSAATSQPPAKETDLTALVSAYAIIGGYSAALMGLFAPVVLLVAFALFGTGDFADGVMYFIFFVIIGAIVWIPLSVILAVILGIGGLLLGLVTGIVAAILFRVTYRHTGLFQAARVLVALLNAAVFGYAGYWIYTYSFFADFFEELTAAPVLIGIIGAAAGFLMAIVDPEKSEDQSELTPEEAEAAGKLLAAPFRLWRSAAGRAGGASTDIIFGSSDAESISQAESKRLEKEWQQQAKQQEWKDRQAKRTEEAWQNKLKRMEEEQRRMAAQIRPLQPPKKKR